MPEERLFTLRELRLCNGDDGPPCVAFQGVVYDLSDCPNWRSGLHRNLHYPGQDLTAEIADAPHAAEVFTRPCVQRVGILV
jgi:predicted heme/steroid binding protein